MTSVSESIAKNATRKLVEHATTLQYRDIPGEVVELTKQCVLDALGVIIGASGLASEAKAVASYAADLGGRPESTVLGFGCKAPAQWAAFVNGSIAHMLDYDDVIDDAVGGAHVTIATMPAAFALAERLGTVDGKALITAIVAGTDIMTRICTGTGVPYWGMKAGWFATQLVGFIASAATAGRLLGLDVTSMENAFGIAYNQMSGSRQMAVASATDLRGMQAGFASQGGIMAAELALRGITGSKDVLEGPYGFFRNYVAAEQPDWQTILGGLGSRYPLLDALQFKVWPSCAYTAPVNAAIQKLRDEHGVAAEDVNVITIVGGNDGTRLLCEPIALKRRPQRAVDGKYSIPFTAAIMMLKGNVTLADYTDAALVDPAVLSMADRVTHRPQAAGPEVRRDAIVSNPAVEIETHAGKVIRAEADRIPGYPGSRPGWDMLERKFRECVSYSARAIAPAHADHAIERIRGLENVRNAADVVKLLQ